MAITLKPLVEVGWCGLAIVDELGNLSIVELVADDRVNAIDWSASRNILAVTTTVGVCVVGVNARLGNLHGGISERL